jgi:hypothetical protein
MVVCLKFPGPGSPRKAATVEPFWVLSSARAPRYRASSHRFEIDGVVLPTGYACAIEPPQGATPCKIALRGLCNSIDAQIFP